MAFQQGPRIWLRQSAGAAPCKGEQATRSEPGRGGYTSFMLVLGIESSCDETGVALVDAAVMKS